ncbi:MAG: TetR family transcriptional regulator [Magnetococcales bacterium]|nr:TetR family transcriptional regulator [Magnetococcales bacterium]HIJ84113.1 TetR/AcrR family transcriptional regulator [Magnetococcales bacterium]
MRQSFPSAKALETREKILDTATRLFYIHGYNATGVDRIIAETGVSKGSFFYQFKSKEELAIRVLDWHREKMQAELAELANTYATAPREHLLAILKTIARKSANYNESCDIRGCIFGNFAMEMSVENQEVRIKVLEILSEFRQNMENLLIKAVQQQELTDSFDCHHTAGVILCQIQGALLLDKAAQEARETDGVIRFVSTLLRLA